MKKLPLLILALLVSVYSFSQDSITKLTPEELVQQQLNGYNALNIEEFIAPFSDSLELYTFPNTLLVKGKKKIKEGYKGFFKSAPNLHCEILSRTVNGNIVIDKERVSGYPNGKTIEVLAIYEIDKDKIQRVYFTEEIIVGTK
tara:strand:+ start:335 stop:763 length:429 start_codon:yes stop_codon:yes gene_type:complete